MDVKQQAQLKEHFNKSKEARLVIIVDYHEIAKNNFKKASATIRDLLSKLYVKEGNQKTIMEFVMILVNNSPNGMTS